MTAFLMMFFSLLFIVIGLGCMFAALVGYCFVLEKKGIDPDEGWAFHGAIALIFIGACLITWLFVTVCIPFIDLIVVMVG